MQLDFVLSLPVNLDIEVVFVNDLEKEQYEQLWADEKPQSAYGLIRRIGGFDQRVFLSFFSVLFSELTRNFKHVQDGGPQGPGAL